uniref:(northern house mosquito) hypothetical protein n=1 Tax=Culex pipiens TaxID=7175 RepID=A0A8D8FCZ3_CULPI
MPESRAFEFFVSSWPNMLNCFSNWDRSSRGTRFSADFGGATSCTASASFTSLSSSRIRAVLSLTFSFSDGVAFGAFGTLPMSSMPLEGVNRKESFRIAQFKLLSSSESDSDSNGGSSDTLFG